MKRITPYRARPARIYPARAGGVMMRLPKSVPIWSSSRWGELRNAMGNGLAILALIPFLISALIAPGMMIAPDRNNLPSLVICTGSGPMQMSMLPDGSLLPQQDSIHSAHNHNHTPDANNNGSGNTDGTDGLAGHDICVWSAHAQLSLDSFGPALPVMVPIAHRVSHSLRDDQHHSTALLHRPTARAPPVVV